MGHVHYELRKTRDYIDYQGIHNPRIRFKDYLWVPYFDSAQSLDCSDLNRTQDPISVHETPSSSDDEDDSTKACQTLQEGIEAETRNTYGATSMHRKSELIRNANKPIQMDLYDELMDQKHFTLRPDIIRRQEAIWELYEVTSEKARNILMGGAHGGLQYVMPTLCKQCADLKKCIDVYIDTLTSLAESHHKRKNKLRSGLEPLADSSIHSPAANMMAEVTTTVPNIPYSLTGLVAPVETKQSATSKQVGMCNPTRSRNSPAETLSSDNGVGTSDSTQARDPFAVNDIAQSCPSEPRPLDVIPMNESGLRPTRSLKQTAKRTYAPFASITSRASRHEMNKD
jgi:hypothetical protein